MMTMTVAPPAGRARASAHRKLMSGKEKTATPGRRRGAAVHFTTAQGGGEGDRLSASVRRCQGGGEAPPVLQSPAQGGGEDRRNSCGMTRPPGMRCRRRQGGGEASSAIITGPGRRRGPAKLVRPDPAAGVESLRRCQGGGEAPPDFHPPAQGGGEDRRNFEALTPLRGEGCGDTREEERCRREVTDGPGRRSGPSDPVITSSGKPARRRTDHGPVRAEVAQFTVGEHGELGNRLAVGSVAGEAFADGICEPGEETAGFGCAGVGVGHHGHCRRAFRRLAMPRRSVSSLRLLGLIYAYAAAAQWPPWQCCYAASAYEMLT